MCARNPKYLFVYYKKIFVIMIFLVIGILTTNPHTKIGNLDIIIILMKQRVNAQTH